VSSTIIITLIGMPGCGKSTVGKVLAAQLGLDLLDTDGLIEAQENQTLQQIVDARGNTAFRAIEEQVLTAMPLSPSVISTGGSVVYYAERVPLYERYGEVIIDCDDETPESIADTLAKTVEKIIK